MPPKRKPVTRSETRKEAESESEAPLREDEPVPPPAAADEPPRKEEATALFAADGEPSAPPPRRKNPQDDNVPGLPPSQLLTFLQDHRESIKLVLLALLVTFASYPWRAPDQPGPARRLCLLSQMLGGSLLFLWAFFWGLARYPLATMAVIVTLGVAYGTWYQEISVGLTRFTISMHRAISGLLVGVN